MCGTTMHLFIKVNPIHTTKTIFSTQWQCMNHNPHEQIPCMLYYAQLATGAETVAGNMIHVA